MVKSEVIDGLAGDLHVTAEQIVDVNIGTYGGDDYVLSTGKEVSAKLISNNKLRIFDGVMVYGGIRDAVSVNEYHDVTIENGSQGMNRNDIVVRHYVKDEVTEYVSAEFIVIKGTPVDGTAVDPDITVTDLRAGALTHDMKLYRVKLEGLNVVAVEPMFKVLYNMADIKKELESLNGKIEKPTLYSSAEKQIGVTDSGEPVYRKTIRSAMTYFSKPSSGYTDCTISVGAYLKKILRADAHIVKNDNTEMYALPYSATGGSWGTWLRSISSSGSQQSVLHFNNNVTWGSAYTLVATIDYTK